MNTDTSKQSRKQAHGALRLIETVIPGVKVARTYKWVWLRADVIAGVTIFAMLVPQGARSWRFPSRESHRSSSMHPGKPGKQRIQISFHMWRRKRRSSAPMLLSWMLRRRRDMFMKPSWLSGRGGLHINELIAQLTWSWLSFQACHPERERRI